ncbi:hypothetical protein [Halorientalis sp. IM1011]|uniref:hypothetical protein n=1 Tax=Halorientalis sp. IM1011 TaxID=1932360 RepID=UPI0012FC7E18|nr:hypothetical protein [Halorientalis sp. IM1011]
MDTRLLAGAVTLGLGVLVVGIALLDLIETVPELTLPVGVLALAVGTLLVGTSGTVKHRAA